MPRLALLAALALLAVSCGGSAESDSAPAPPAAAGPGTDIAGETLDGERLSLADFRGSPVFVNVWSSW
jgi:hypothetical protein